MDSLPPERDPARVPHRSADFEVAVAGPGRLTPFWSGRPIGRAAEATSPSAVGNNAPSSHLKVKASVGPLT